MKTKSLIERLFTALFFVLSVICATSCSKELNEEEIHPSNETPTTNVILDNIPNIPNPLNIKEYIPNPNDLDDEKINEQLLKIAESTRELLRETPSNNIIYSKAKASANKCVNLKNFAESHKLKSASLAYYSFSKAIQMADLTHASQNPLTKGVIEEYVPAIHFINIETADENKQPIICPGFEVNSDLPGMEKYEDYIVAWYYDKKGCLKEILINEETAMNTKHPVFIIENAEEESINKSVSFFEKTNTSQLKSSSYATYWTREFQINHRYEGSGRSEFCFSGALIDENGNHAWICLDNDGYGYNTYREIASVSKNDINKIHYRNDIFCQNETEPRYSNYIFWNTFERDWYSSSKSLGTGTRNSKSVTLQGNRKYSSEWYAYDPLLLNNYPFDLIGCYNRGYNWYSGNKGKFKVSVVRNN